MKKGQDCMKALISGFEPFGKLTVNPSWEAVKLVPERPGKNISVRKLLLPVEYDRAADMLLEAAEGYRPDVILAVGVAANRSAVTPEYVAVNCKDSPMADNKGKLAIMERIIDEGDSALYTNLPLPDLIDAIQAAGIPSGISFDAGTYVCNNVFYRLMYEIRHNMKKTYGGFLHVPGEKAVSVKESAHAIEAMLLRMADKFATVK